MNPQTVSRCSTHRKRRWSWPSRTSRWQTVNLLTAKLKEFMEHGGRVLLAGSGSIAGLLPDGKAAAPGEFMPKLCETVPEGTGPLAAAGSAEMAFEGSWAADGPQFRVEQRCATSPVVVRFPVGAGEAVWWASATPLTNAGLKHDANLKLLLASVGEGREVYFDEYYFGGHMTASPLSADRRVLWTLFWQFVLLFALVVWSFSRRKGPLRLPVTCAAFVAGGVRTEHGRSLRQGPRDRAGGRGSAAEAGAAAGKRGRAELGHGPKRSGSRGRGADGALRRRLERVATAPRSSARSQIDTAISRRCAGAGALDCG